MLLRCLFTRRREQGLTYTVLLDLTEISDAIVCNLLRLYRTQVRSIVEAECQATYGEGTPQRKGIQFPMRGTQI